ncbi:DUF5638 domain-containing protein [Legionella cherrii]|uniref:DUF5638 domain-containing protein n=1 Tax=Legionella cherrii TaxID=28084 RepID=A0A0W0S973_9GAMM|nr:DUF5638 domain-containing protein [Legionella cherrii]KTC79461.1 hypothetical protein Lche_1481 [Legionella cherrii]VEB37311.1 Uncharacterised protein [Legionella cherrii]
MSKLEERLELCNKKIDALFHGLKLSAEIENELETIKYYYYALYKAANFEEDEEECINIYELLVTGLEEIKSGVSKPDEVLKTVEEIKSLRKKGVVLENICNAIELLFWAGSACTFFSYSILMAAPLAAANPFFALAVIAIASLAAIYSVVNLLNCIDEFKSCAPIEKEYNREKNLISFFKPALTSSERSSQESDELTYPTESLYPQVINMSTN